MKLTEFSLNGDWKSRNARPGLSTNQAWTDEHMRYAYKWLLETPESPFYPNKWWALCTALGMDTRDRMTNFRALMAGEGDYKLSYKARVFRTRRFRMILRGILTVKGGKITARGQFKYWEIVKAEEPKALNCPPVYRGRVQITSRGLKMGVSRTDYVGGTNDVEGKSRLTNPFGKR
jgi:hypothetical protein